MTRSEFAYGGLMKYFEEISSIPRPTFHEERIAEYLCDFAEARGLEYYRDDANNVFIKKSGTQGRECESPILLQGHTDMVCEKNEDTQHDFLNEGLKLYEDNGLLRAKGTTLGADNGDAVAVMLYVLDGAEGHLTSHPPLECLFTASEEVGLDGAKSFDYSKISARRMINMDSADESQILTGCAGGMRTTLRYVPGTEDAQGEGVEIHIKGLAGGHSGEDIDKGRANSNKLMGRVLLELSGFEGFRVASIDGGSKDNAITRETRAVVTVNCAKELIARVSDIKEKIAEELCKDDGGFSLSAKKCSLPEKVMSLESGKTVVFFLATVQNGIFEMNHSIKNLVEFSRNIGVVATDKNMESIRFTFLSRSPRDSQIKSSLAQLESYADILGMTVEHGNYYPGWAYAEHSPMRDTYAKAYRDLFDSDIEITTIHAGLECGIIKERIPDMDMISCGPIVRCLHSPDEYMDIASFERFFTIIKNVISK